MIQKHTPTYQKSLYCVEFYLSVPYTLIQIFVSVTNTLPKAISYQVH